MTGERIDISLILPAHNEEGALKELLPEIRSVLDSMETGYEVIVVDDASTDETAGIVEGFMKGWPALGLERHPFNRGQTEAIKTGIRRSRGRIVVTMDADGQNLPGDIPALVARLESGNLLMVAGRRRSRKDPLMRRIPSMIANILISLASGTRISDTGCGLKAIDGDLLRSMRLGPDSHRLLPVILAMEGVPYEVIDVGHRARISGRAHYGLERTFSVILDVIALRFTVPRSRPYHTLGLAGFLLSVVSGFLCVYILYEKYYLGIWVHRNPLFLVAIVLFMTGLQVFILGLICEIMAVLHSGGGYAEKSIPPAGDAGE